MPSGSATRSSIDESMIAIAQPSEAPSQSTASMVEDFRYSAKGEPTILPIWAVLLWLCDHSSRWARRRCSSRSASVTGTFSAASPMRRLRPSRRRHSRAVIRFVFFFSIASTEPPLFHGKQLLRRQIDPLGDLTVDLGGVKLRGQGTRADR